MKKIYILALMILIFATAVYAQATNIEIHKTGFNAKYKLEKKGNNFYFSRAKDETYGLDKHIDETKAFSSEKSAYNYLTGSIDSYLKTSEVKVSDVTVGDTQYKYETGKLVDKEKNTAVYTAPLAKPKGRTPKKPVKKQTSTPDATQKEGLTRQNNIDVLTVQNDGNKNFYPYNVATVDGRLAYKYTGSGKVFAYYTGKEIEQAYKNVGADVPPEIKKAIEEGNGGAYLKLDSNNKLNAKDTEPSLNNKELAEWTQKTDKLNKMRKTVFTKAGEKVPKVTAPPVQKIDLTSMGANTDMYFYEDDDGNYILVSDLRNPENRELDKKTSETDEPGVPTLSTNLRGDITKTTMDKKMYEAFFGKTGVATGMTASQFKALNEELALGRAGKEDKLKVEEDGTTKITDKDGREVIVTKTDDGTINFAYDNKIDRATYDENLKEVNDELKELREEKSDLVTQIDNLETALAEEQDKDEPDTSRLSQIQLELDQNNKLLQSMETEETQLLGKRTEVKGTYQERYGIIAIGPDGTRLKHTQAGDFYIKTNGDYGYVDSNGDFQPLRENGRDVECKTDVCKQKQGQAQGSIVTNFLSEVTGIEKLSYYIQSAKEGFNTAVQFANTGNQIWALFNDGDSYWWVSRQTVEEWYIAGDREIAEACTVNLRKDKTNVLVSEQAQGDVLYADNGFTQVMAGYINAERSEVFTDPETGKQTAFYKVEFTVSAINRDIEINVDLRRGGGSQAPTQFGVELFADNVVLLKGESFEKRGTTAVTKYSTKMPPYDWACIHFYRGSAGYTLDQRELCTPVVVDNAGMENFDFAQAFEGTQVGDLTLWWDTEGCIEDTDCPGTQVCEEFECVNKADAGAGTPSQQRRQSSQQTQNQEVNTDW